MLEHYLGKISSLEFSERNSEIPKIVAKKKGQLHAIGMLNSTVALQGLAEFFTAEYYERCDFIKNFVISYYSLLDLSKEIDIVTSAKTIFQNASFLERDSLKELYWLTIKSIEGSLFNERMKNETETSFNNLMNRRIEKNNLYIEVAYQKVSSVCSEANKVLFLQPNVSGIGIDLVELWNRYIK